MPRTTKTAPAANVPAKAVIPPTAKQLSTYNGLVKRFKDELDSNLNVILNVQVKDGQPAFKSLGQAAMVIHKTFVMLMVRQRNRRMRLIDDIRVPNVAAQATAENAPVPAAAAA